jgi:glycosyltransferase involved in cell wall biosynthesis
VVTPVGGHFANRWLFRRAARVVCVSRATRAGYESSNRLPAGRLEVILSGSCDLERFRPADAERRAECRRRLEIEPDARVAVLVGRMQSVKRVKGHEFFLRAAAAVAERLPRAVFLLVGDGAGRGDVERQIAELNLADRVSLLGRRDDVPEILAACDLGVVASLESEGFSRAALEYMGTGLAVVATRVGALPEIVVPDETGRLVEPSGASGLAEAVTDLLGNPERCAEMGRAGRERAESHFSREKWLDAHERVYREALGAEARAR